MDKSKYKSHNAIRLYSSLVLHAVHMLLDLEIIADLGINGYVQCLNKHVLDLCSRRQYIASIQLPTRAHAQTLGWFHFNAAHKLFRATQTNSTVHKSKQFYKNKGLKVKMTTNDNFIICKRLSSSLIATCDKSKLTSRFTNSKLTSRDERFSSKNKISIDMQRNLKKK